MSIKIFYLLAILLHFAFIGTEQEKTFMKFENQFVLLKKFKMRPTILKIILATGKVKVLRSDLHFTCIFIWISLLILSPLLNPCQV